MAAQAAANDLCTCISSTSGRPGFVAVAGAARRWRITIGASVNCINADVAGCAQARTRTRTQNSHRGRPTGRERERERVIAAAFSFGNSWRNEGQRQWRFVPLVLCTTYVLFNSSLYSIEQFQLRYREIGSEIAADI